MAIPVSIPDTCTIYPLDLASGVFDMIVSPSEPVSIVGFPLGLASAGKFPIWKTGHVASDLDLDYEGKPLFLIDATTKPAMSGSPVIARRIGSYRSTAGLNLGADAVRFLGVYSGRVNENIDASIGYVWKPHVIDDIFGKAGV